MASVAERSEQHGKNQHPWGPSTPRDPSVVARDKSVRRSAQDDNSVETITLIRTCGTN
jgi:hypothetical protein